MYTIILMIVMIFRSDSMVSFKGISAILGISAQLKGLEVVQVML